MRVAAIDLGTNSFLCLLCEVSDNHGLTVLQDVCRVVRLGEKVHQNRRFLPQALARAEVALKEFSGLIKKYDVKTVVATATSAARDVSNGEALVDLGAQYGIPISIVAGEREAFLSFEGALSGTEEKVKSLLVVDVGGGSTELIFKEPGKDLRAESFDVGCVRLTEMLLKNDCVTAEEIRDVTAYAQKAFQGFGKASPEKIIAVAGTPTTLACLEMGIDFENTKVDGYKLSKSQIEKQILHLGSIPLAERKKIKGLEALRADVIVAGGALLLAAMDFADLSELTVSTRGLRYGVALHYKEFLK